MRPRLIITAGDPAGIGPEIVIKALSDPQVYRRCIPVVMADRQVLADALLLTGAGLSLCQVRGCREAAGQHGVLEFLDPNVLKNMPYQVGGVSAECGEAAFQYVARAVEAAVKGDAAGLVTAPINKEAIHLAGHNFPGHTEILAHLTGAQKYAMLLVSGSLRVIHVTTHVSVRDMCDMITKQRVYETILLARQALREMGVCDPRIAVAGLNPHASENGLFGREEENEIIPAVQMAASEGMRVQGPIPPDTVFVKAVGGLYDAVVAMYHDQGHIPLKLCGFRMDPDTGEFTSVAGVNVTVGLPIVRTSVDHGTAFDRAGKNIANAESMTDAIMLAAQIAGEREKA